MLRQFHSQNVPRGDIPIVVGGFTQNNNTSGFGPRSNIVTEPASFGLTHSAWTWSGNGYNSVPNVTISVVYFKDISFWQGGEVVLNGLNNNLFSSGAYQDYIFGLIEYDPTDWSLSAGVSYNAIIAKMNATTNKLTFPKGVAANTPTSFDISGCYIDGSHKTLVCYNPIITSQYKCTGVYNCGIMTNGGKYF